MQLPVPLRWLMWVMATSCFDYEAADRGSGMTSFVPRLSGVFGISEPLEWQYTRRYHLMLLFGDRLVLVPFSDVPGLVQVTRHYMAHYSRFSGRETLSKTRRPRKRPPYLRKRRGWRMPDSSSPALCLGSTARGRTTLLLASSQMRR